MGFRTLNKPRYEYICDRCDCKRISEVEKLPTDWKLINIRSTLSISFSFPSNDADEFLTCNNCSMDILSIFLK